MYTTERVHSSHESSARRNEHAAEVSRQARLLEHRSRFPARRIFGVSGLKLVRTETKGLPRMGWVMEDESDSLWAMFPAFSRDHYTYIYRVDVVSSCCEIFNDFWLVSLRRARQVLCTDYFALFALNSRHSRMPCALFNWIHKYQTLDRKEA